MGTEDAPGGPGMTEAAFVGLYGDREVWRFGAATLTLADMLEKEAEAREDDICTATDEQMADPAVRVGYLAALVDRAGQLAEEHRYLLPPPKPGAAAS